MHEIAISQYGAFSLRQALDAGASYDLIERRVHAERWTHLTPAALALSGTAVQWHTRAMAAVLSTPGSVVSGRAAARLFGVGPYGRIPIEVTAPFTANARAWGYTVRRCRHFAHLLTTTVEAIPAMGIEEVFVDLARREPRGLVQRIVEESIVKRITSMDSIGDVVGRRLESRCPGAAPVSRILADLTGKGVPESELERILLRLVDHVSLPGLELQAGMEWWEEGKGRVDVAIPAAKLILEADGRRWHSREQDFEWDRLRDNQAAANGWRVLRFTHAMLRDDPLGCVQAIQCAIS